MGQKDESKTVNYMVSFGKMYSNPLDASFVSKSLITLLKWTFTCTMKICLSQVQLKTNNENSGFKWQCYRDIQAKFVLQFICFFFQKLFLWKDYYEKSHWKKWKQTPNYEIYIDYYMLRTWYLFYSRVFNTISRPSESSSECAIWYLKRVNENDIRLLTCNNLFVTYYMLKKNQATKLKYKKASIKLESNSSRQVWHQASAKM